MEDGNGSFATQSECEANCSENNTGTITAISCDNATNAGTLTEGQTASGVTSSVPYTGGNGEGHNGQTVNSIDVTGLTATVAAGSFAYGNGNLTYTITGSPNSAGNASFALNIGGRNCTLVRTVSSAQPQYPSGTVHCSGTPTLVIDVTNPTTGKIWMDRNLGASQVATASTNNSGDLYQWGRGADGHQCRNSSTTNVVSNSNQPGHNDFIIAPDDWRSPPNDNLWQGVEGVNNPCPSGYRLPTEAELNDERVSWSSNNSTGAFASPLKLTLAGFRRGSDGSFDTQFGTYWSSTVSGFFSIRLSFRASTASVSTTYRTTGHSVRCIKD
ncbi:MAG: hypothetical protein JJU02_03410 [Cryomorphaceae bacterium]|nr:hypothetical protein [Cryomorphaceae bacterium]